MTKPNFQLVGVGEPVERFRSGSQSSDQTDPFTPAHFAGISGRRVAAYIVDLVLLGIASPILFFGFKVVGVLTFGLLTPLLLLVWSLFALIYHTLFIASQWSATPGLRLLGIEVRSWNGHRPSLPQAALQTVVF